MTSVVAGTPKSTQVTNLRGNVMSPSGVQTMSATGAPTTSATGAGGLSSFLTEGAKIPEGSALKASTSQTVLPEWYTDYAKNLLSGQAAISGQPYSTYQGPRVAGFTPQQQQAMQMTMGAAGAYQPALNTAMSLTSGLAGQSALTAAQPYLQNAASMNAAAAGMAPSADFSGAISAGQDALKNSGLSIAQPYLDQAAGINGATVARPYYDAAGNLITQGTAALGMDAAAPWLSQAGGINASTAANPYFAQALQASQAALGQGGLQAAQPYLDAAGGKTTDVSEYMDPYMDSVVSRIADLGERTLHEKLLPGIRDKFISAGQWGGSGQTTDTARALRDISADVTAQQQQALSEGFRAAQATAIADKNRFGQLGATAGSLGSQQQQAGLQAAGLQSNIGGQIGGLEQARQNALTQIGSTYGQLGGQQQDALLKAAGIKTDMGSQLGGLEMARGNLLASVGSTAGNLGSQQQQAALKFADIQANAAAKSAEIQAQAQANMISAANGAANIGGQIGGLAGADLSRGLDAAGQIASLGGLAQSYGLTGAGAVGQVGAQQQALNQKSLDTAYSDFLRQQGYPQEQITRMLETFKGVGGGIPTASTEFGIVPTGANDNYKPSTASQIASGLSGLGGLISAFKGI